MSDQEPCIDTLNPECHLPYQKPCSNPTGWLRAATALGPEGRKDDRLLQDHVAFHHKGRLTSSIRGGHYYV